MGIDNFDKKNYFLINFGIVIVFLVFIFIILILNYLKIENHSIIELCVKYYLYRN